MLKRFVVKIKKKIKNGENVFYIILLIKKFRNFLLNSLFLYKFF